jgi:glycosyltransferase involved in cell wall biosynthesis
VCIAASENDISTQLPVGVSIIPVNGYWNRQFGQQVLSGIGKAFSSVPYLKTCWNALQMYVSWRVIYWHNMRFMKRVVKLLNRRWQEFDVAYVHGDALLAAQISDNIQTILRLPGPIGKDYLPALKKIHFVCANGDAFQKMHVLFGDIKKLYELPVGLDLELFSPQKSDHYGDNNKVVIGYVGRVTVLKGVHLLVSAFCQVAGLFPEAFLLIVGDGENISTLQQIVQKAGLENRVNWAGRRALDELPDLYRNMDVFVMPSLYENFSNAILEAMGCGLPIIASRVGGNTMMVSERNGWLFDSDSVNSLTSTLETALTFRSELRRKGQVSRALVVNAYSWEHMTDALEDLMAIGLQK